MAESPGEDFNEWMKERIDYLPGDIWPEAWLMQAGKETLDDLVAWVKSDLDLVVEALNKGTKAGKHSELLTAGKELGLDPQDFLQTIAGVVTRKFSERFSEMIDRIGKALDQY